MVGITGTALTATGNDVNYVRIFEWSTGNVIKVEYGSEWSLSTKFDVDIGITCVGDDSRPISKGPYKVMGKFGTSLNSGYLFIAGASTNYDARYDVNAINHKDWSANFEQTEDIGLFNYSNTSQSVSYQSKIINYFDINWKLRILGENKGYYDTHNWTLELMTDDNEVIFALKSEYNTTYKAKLSYGKNLLDLTVAPNGWSSTVYTDGVLLFDNESVSYYSLLEYDWTGPFVFYTKHIKNVTKVRVGGAASGSSSFKGGYIRIMKPGEEYTK